MPLGSFGFSENLTLAVPFAAVVVESVTVAPFGFVTTMVTAAPATGTWLELTLAPIVAERLLPRLTEAEVVTSRPAASTTDAVADPK